LKVELYKIVDDIEQVAREIYYAMTYLPDSSPARANLNQALILLGIKNPKQIGLSDSVLTRRELCKKYNIDYEEFLMVQSRLAHLDANKQTHDLIKSILHSMGEHLQEASFLFYALFK